MAAARRHSVQHKSLGDRPSHESRQQPKSDRLLGRYIPPAIYKLMQISILPFISHSPAKASLPTLLASLGGSVKDGEYYGPKGFLEMTGPSAKAKVAPQDLDKTQAAKLWQLSEELTQVAYRL